MQPREKLLQEIAEAPDFLVEEVLDFLLFVKARRIPDELPNQPQKNRPIGLCAGEFTVPPDFDDPLPD